MFDCPDRFAETILDTAQLFEPWHVLIGLQHEVIPSGGLRFALTCRHIDPQTLLDDDERRIAAKKGTFPPGSEQYDYNGDIHAVASIPKQNKGADIANDIRTRFEVGELELEDMEQLLQHITKCITTIT